MAYNVESLGAYVQENKDIILKDIVFGGEYGNTIPLMTKQLGIKTTEKIHPSTLEAVLQDVSGECGFNPQGDLKITDREIITKQKKVNMEFCLEKLLGKFAEYTVRVGANQDALPFEAEIIDGLVKSINKQVEKDVWTDLITNTTAQLTVASTGTAYERIMAVYMALPEAILEDAVIFVSPATFREYVNDLVNKNFYHYNPADGDLEEIFIPGSGVKVRKALGLAGQTEDVIFGTSPKNMIYGTDFMDNKEEVKAWFSDDNDTYRIKVRFNYGANVAFPDLVVGSKKSA